MGDKYDFSDIPISQLNLLIDEYIHNERDRNILKRRLCDHIYYEPLAEEFGLSPQRVKAIVAKTRERLFKAIR